MTDVFLLALSTLLCEHHLHIAAASDLACAHSSWIAVLLLAVAPSDLAHDTLSVSRPFIRGNHDPKELHVMCRNFPKDIIGVRFGRLDGER